MSLHEWTNAIALGASFGVCIGEMKALEFLTSKGVLSRDVSRKMHHKMRASQSKTNYVALGPLVIFATLISIHLSMPFIHILTGPLYLLCWYMFDDSSSAKYWACMVPLAMTLKVGAIGAGLLRDPDFVNSMSRSGRASELLLGPFTYGAIFVTSTLVYWRHSPGGILSMLLLCVGDGFAGLLGHKFGRRSLPHNRSKTWVGSLSFIGLSIPAILGYISIFNRWGWLSYSVQNNWLSVSAVVTAAAAVESLPLGDWDNVIVFVTSLLLTKFL